MYPSVSAISIKRNSGFALVLALSLMAFVLLLLLSISTLVRVETSASNIVLNKLKADQNALLAVYQAVGSLQKEMGPDQRISANADILSNAGTLQGEHALDVKNPYLLGVWDSSGNRNNATVDERALDAWEIGAAINYGSRAQSGFRGWLISSPEDGDDALNLQDFVTAGNQTFRNPSSTTVKLLGGGTLQADAPDAVTAPLDQDEIWAPLVEIESDQGPLSRGHFAWAVLDEGVKARLNLNNREPAVSNADRLTYWDSPGSLGMEAMGPSGEFSSFPRNGNLAAKVRSFNQASLMFGGAPSQNDLGTYYHDLSLYSMSTLTNVIDGGLKRDLSTLADARPASYLNRRLYSGTSAAAQSGVSNINSEAEPHWSALLDYVNLYKDSARLSPGASSSQLPSAQMTASEWKGTPSAPGAGDRASIDLPLPAPDEYRIAPAVTKVEMFLSLVALRPHENGNRYGRSATSFYSNRFLPSEMPDQTVDTIENLNRVRQVYLCMVPVITLHNPYNIPLDINNMWVVFRDPPIGLKFYLYNHLGNADGADETTPIPMTENFVALAEMVGGNFAAGAGGDVKQLRFSMRLAGETLAAGETRVFSPQFQNNATVGDLSNIRADKQFDLVLGAGYDEGVGLYWDQFTPTTANRTNDDVSVIGWFLDASDGTVKQETRKIKAHQEDRGIAIINGDRLRVAATLVDGTKNPKDISADAPNEPYNGTFSVELYGEDPGIAGNNTEDSDSTPMIGRHVFDYNTGSLASASKSTSEEDREELLAKSVSVKNESYDDIDGLMAVNEVPYSGGNLDTSLVDRRGNVTVDQLSPYTFAVFRVGGKVTKEESAIAYHPAVPALHTNLSQLAGHYDVGEESSAFTAYDLSVQVPPGGTGRLLPFVGPNNGGFHFTGQLQTVGIGAATQYELPVAPLQSVASLQHADIFGGGYLPKVRYTVGNSFAHPLLAANSAAELPTADRYGFFDHVYLSNHRLWDRYYFSTIADQKSIFASAAPTASETFDEWATGGEAPNAALKIHPAKNATTAEIKTELFAGNTPQDDAYLKVAGYQMLEGGFNINSTSVEAWRALLATSNLANSAISIPTAANAALSMEDATGTGNIQVGFTRFRIPNFGDPIDSSSTADINRALWQGYRELDATQIDDLAEAIVDQVRYRGPFLSLAEFVNRRLSSDNRSQMGVIDAAIEAAGLNQLINTNAGRDLDAASVSYLENNDYNMIKNEEPLSLGTKTARGIPAFLTQADILQSIGPRLTARSDTFVIRAYGEVLSDFGEIDARSICEVVVQRVSDYVDTNQDPYHDSDDQTLQPDGLSDINEAFGRQFKIIHLRWLNTDEV